MLLDTGLQFTTKKSFLNQHLFVTTISVVDHIQYPRRVPIPWKKMQHFCIAIVKHFEYFTGKTIHPHICNRYRPTFYTQHVLRLIHRTPYKAAVERLESSLILAIDMCN